jgi:hypothetical protein
MLVTWVPHWAAVVHVFDNAYTPVSTLTPKADDTTAGPYLIELPLAAGVYGIRVTVGTSSSDEWVSIRSGKKTSVPAERWAALQLPSAAPLTYDAPEPSESVLTNAREAEKTSRTITWSAPDTGPSRLFIFVRTQDAARYPQFAHGLSLLDAEGQTLTPLTGNAVASDATASWIAFTTDLPGGFYILERESPDGLRYKQPLYLCDGWETQVFMVGGRGPSFRSLTLNMAPLGQGFRFDDQTAAASEAVLASLRGEVSLGTVLDSTHLGRALRADNYRNPWLAVLVAYAAMRADAYSQRAVKYQQETSYDSVLKDDAIAYLRNTIPDHPDVRAILLDSHAASPKPFDVPPLMRIGLQRVQRHAAEFPNTIPVGSLTERVLAGQVTSSPWSVWREKLRDARESSVAADEASPESDEGVVHFAAPMMPKDARTLTIEGCVRALEDAAAQLGDLRDAKAVQQLESVQTSASVDLQASAAALAKRFEAIARTVLERADVAGSTNADGTWSPDDALNRLTTALSSLTLHASFTQYGSAKRRATSLDALERLATGLEHDLSQDGGRNDNAAAGR